MEMSSKFEPFILNGKVKKKCFVFSCGSLGGEGGEGKTLTVKIR